MSRRTRGFVALLPVVLVGTLLSWPAMVAAAVPNAVADAFTVQKDDGAIALNVLANDTHDPLTSEIVTPTDPDNGTVVVDPDGQGLTYDPDQSYTGPDSFTYTIHDTDDPGSDSTATVTITVNAPPVAVDDPNVTDCNSDGSFGGTYLVVEDYGQTPFFGDCALIANDTDSDGTVVDWEIVTDPTHGDAQHIDHEFGGYTPDADFSTIAGNEPGGQWVSDSFTYRAKDDDDGWSQPATMRFWVAPVNDEPAFVSPPSQVAVDEDSGAYDVSWLPYGSAGPANESGQTLDFVITQVDSHGLVNLFSVPPDFTAGGHLTFTPGPDEYGLATITVHLHDDGGREDYGINNLPDPPDDTSDSITFDILVNPVGDAPVATDDSITVAEDSAATAITVLSNDSIAPDAAETLTITGTSASTHGTVTITGGGTGLSYKPNANYNGSDSFTYTISDGNGGTAIATVNVTITAVNDSPTATADAKTLAEDSTATAITVLSNDSIEPDAGETLTITGTSAGSHGTVEITGGGTGLTYRPHANYNGSDSFTYTIGDGNGSTAIATVNVTITPVNDSPNAINDGVPTTIKIGTGAGPVPIAVLANDTSSPDGPEILKITAVTQGSNGTIAIIDRGKRLTYDPTGVTTGIDVFQYTISDGHGGTDTATVQVEVVADTSAAETTAPVVAITPLAQPATVRLVVTWTAHDPESGASSVLQVRRDGGAWTTVTLVDPRSTRAVLLVPTGHTYQFQVSATNGIGMLTVFKLGAIVSV